MWVCIGCFVCFAGGSVRLKTYIPYKDFYFSAIKFTHLQFTFNKKEETTLKFTHSMSLMFSQKQIYGKNPYALPRLIFFLSVYGEIWIVQFCVMHIIMIADKKIIFKNTIHAMVFAIIRNHFRKKMITEEIISNNSAKVLIAEWSKYFQ